MPTIPNIVPPPQLDNAIFAPTVITEPGAYVVRQNIDATTGPIIRIQANNVSLDLGAYTLSLPGSPAAQEIIAIDPGFTNIAIENGTLAGGDYGIRHESTGAGKIRVQIANLTVKDFSHRGIALNYVEHIDLLDNRIISESNSGVQIMASAGFCTGQILRNTFRCADSFVFMAMGINGALLKDNQLRGESDGIGISLTGNANIVEGNAISSLHGVPITVDGNNNLILSNTIGGSFQNGIRLQKNSNLVSGNVVGGTTNGVTIEGANNLIENNTLGGNREYGINFVSGANNAYRNNMLRGNDMAPVQDPGGNTDAGGNIV